MATKHKYSPGKTGSIVDALHILICFLVCIMAVFAVTDPQRYSFLFPLIFLMAALLSLLTAWYTLITHMRNKRKVLESAVYFFIAFILIVLFVVSAISIWFHN